MPFPPLVVSGQTISASHINAIRNALITWPGDVSAGGNNLTNVANVGAATVTATGVVTGSQLVASGGLLNLESALPQLTWKETDGGTDAKIWKIYAQGETLNFVTVNDADTAGTAWMSVTRSGATPAAISLPGNVSLGVGATPAAPLHVLRTTTDEQIRFSNDLVNYFFIGRRASDGKCVLNGNQAAGFSGLVLAFGNIEKFLFHGDGKMTIVSPLPGPYADNSAAVAAGLTAGQLYRDSSNNVKQVQ